MNNKPICPYCGEPLEKFPKRKKKCPSCKETIFLKRLPSEKEKSLVTEERASEIEKIWEVQQFEKYDLMEMQKLGLAKSTYNSRKKDWQNSNKSLSDFKWSLYNELLTLNSNNYQNQSYIYLVMANILANEGKDGFNLRQQSKKAELLSYKGMGANKVIIISAKEQSCENCQKLEGLVYDLDKALKLMPLPCKDCSSHYGFCRCVYSPVK